MIYYRPNNDITTQQVSMRNIALKIVGRHYKPILQCDMAPTMFLKNTLQTSYSKIVDRYYKPILRCDMTSTMFLKDTLQTLHNYASYRSSKITENVSSKYLTKFLL